MIDTEIMEGVVAEVQFEPTPKLIEIKTKFWALFKSQAGYEAGMVPTRAAIRKLVNSSSVDKKWNTEGFQEWFLNDTQFEQRLIEHEQTMLTQLLTIATNGDKDSDKLKALSMFFEMSGRFKKKAPEKVYADAGVNEMSEEQIMEALRKDKGLIDESSVD